MHTLLNVTKKWNSYHFIQDKAKATEEYDMIVKGLVDISLAVPSYYPGRFPLEEAFHLPFLCQGNMGDPTTDRVLKMMYEKYLIPIHFNDLKVLYYTRYARGALRMSKKPVKNKMGRPLVTQ